MSDELTRLRIENMIERKSYSIDIIKPSAGWLNDPEWDEFLDSWSELINYYASQGDTVIGPIALGVYVDFARILRKLLLSGELDEKQREQAEEGLISLDGSMDEVRKETRTNLREHHPGLGL